MATTCFYLAAIFCFAAAACTGSLLLFTLGPMNLSNAVVFGGGDED